MATHSCGGWKDAGYNSRRGDSSFQTFHGGRGRIPPRRMNILGVTQAYYPFLEKGGPTVKVRAIARGLVAAGHDVSVLTADLGIASANTDRIETAPDKFGFISHSDGVESIYLRTRACYRALTWNAGVAAFCKQRLASFDLVHIFGLYDFLGPSVARACRRASIPYVVEPMGMFRPIVRSLALKRTYHLLLGGAMIRGARRVIATSEQERVELIEGGVPVRKIFLRRNGIEVPAEMPPAGMFRDRWRIPADAKLVLFLGRLVSKKSPELLLEAFARWQGRAIGSRPSLLVLAGPDEGDGYRQQLEAKARQLGLNGGVLFTGPLYDAAKWSAYRDADVFVLPSQNENFGNTAAEAVACGTPVLVTDRCGIAPLVDRRAGLVVPHECAALEAGLEQLLDTSARARQLRAACPEVARSLNWTEPLAALEALYHELVRKRASA